MKKPLLSVMICASLILAGCTLSKTTPPSSTTGLEIQNASSNSITKFSYDNIKINSSHNFTYNSGSDILIADVPELKIRLVFDYKKYKEICGNPGNSCVGTTIFPVDHYIGEAISVNNNSVLNGVFTIYDKNPDENIENVIYTSYSISKDKCPLTSIKTNSMNGVAMINATMYQIDYSYFETNGVVNETSINASCGNLAKHDIYFDKQYPDRYLVSTANYSERHPDELTSFTHIEYTN